MSKTIKDIRDRDQFFTKDEISKKCIAKVKEYIQIMERSLYGLCLIEPSAGNGDFYYNFPQKWFKAAFDIDKPSYIDDPTYNEEDFLSLAGAPINSAYIGNPPFGKSGGLAFKFIQKCIELNASIIAFILPPNINTIARYNAIKRSGYDLVYREHLPSNSFYFSKDNKFIDVDAETIFHIYIKHEYTKMFNITVIDGENLRNSANIEVHTINTNVIKNAKRDTDIKTFSQDGIGKEWIGKCDFYLPLRVFNSKKQSKPIEFCDSFDHPDMANIGFGVICADKNIKNRIDIENCYTTGMNKISIAKKQLILKEIMRVYNNLEKGE